jgi:hypothetical protein
MSLRKRIMFWLWDSTPDWTPEWFTTTAARTCCRIWGHDPIADQCGIPAHDFCGWCQKTMPNQAPRARETAP